MNIIFKSNQHYRVVLEHVSFTLGKLYLEWIKNKFPIIYTKHKIQLINLANENDLYGKPIKSANKDYGKILTILFNIKNLISKPTPIGLYS